MHRRFTVWLVIVLTAAASGCNPFYSVEQSDVERGYRWISRGDFAAAIRTFEGTLKDTPQSGLATLGLADALAQSGREREAYTLYGRALERLAQDGIASQSPNVGEVQVVGERFLSYQNQGLQFPHGVSAYIFFNRGYALERVIKRERPAPVSFRALAVNDYEEAARLAPTWEEPRQRASCLKAPERAVCTVP